MSESILWLYDLTASQLEAAKAVLRALLRPKDHDLALLYTSAMPEGKRFDLCLQLELAAEEAADLVSVISRSLDTPFECTHLGQSVSLWRYTAVTGLHHVHLDSFASPVLSEPLLIEAIASSRGNGVVLAGRIRRALGTQLDELLEEYRLRSGGASARRISLAS